MDLFSGVSQQIGDDEQLEMLRADLGDDVLSLLLNRAVDGVQETVDELKTSADNSDTETLRRLAHAMKGSTGSLYSIRLSEMAAVLEKHHAELGRIKASFPEFEKTAKTTVDWWGTKISEFA
ncbi:Hpt domain-containing protein [Sneathiella glossodoripedis]|uniref:Hpt domain-containing protein n=1 Tax=Sneathiella glossodoripedis TaxID=418853 RepID=UPI000471078D|nr:Hpt domain-containing protein [Sneathiella glossodoripedis]